MVIAMSKWQRWSGIFGLAYAALQIATFPIFASTGPTPPGFDSAQIAD